MSGLLSLAAGLALSASPSPAPSTPPIRLAPVRPNAAPLPFSAGDTPVFVPVFLPVPFVAVAAGASYENFAIGSTRHEARVVGGYYWSRNTYFDPLVSNARILDTPEGPSAIADTWQLRGTWGWRMTPWATLYLESLGIQGGPAATGGYDDALAGGASISTGPILQLSSLDARAYPTRGWLLRTGVGYGRHFGSTTFDFQRTGLDLQRFIPLSAASTVALRVVGQAATPQLAWIDKFAAGGGAFVRGYAWNRFTGDRLLAASMEYRRILEPDVLSRFGYTSKLLPLKVGLVSVTYLDAGRVWESRRGFGLPVGTDVRLGVGSGLMALLNGIPVGRVELGVSPEGLYPIASGGASF